MLRQIENAVSNGEYTLDGMSDIEKKAFFELGVSKTVYGLVYPETSNITRITLGGFGLEDGFQKPYTKVQDRMHDVLFDNFFEWAKLRGVKINEEKFVERYPTSGSNEAIKDTIAYLGSREIDGYKPKIHVFKGDYEGYKMNALAHNVCVVEHEREDFEKTIKENFKKGDRFYVSQPSGIDGNYWSGYEEFMNFLQNEVPEMKVMLDLAYLGTSAEEEVPEIDASHNNISGIFFSTSKSFGTYYQRIGGLVSREAIPSLYGNKWFKSLPAITVGSTLLRNSRNETLALKYSRYRREALKILQDVSDVEIVGSDVNLLATSVIPANPTDIQRYLTREKLVRYCLTPLTDILMKNEL